MQKNYTDHDFIRFYYQESTPEEAASIRNEMEVNPEFAELCKQTEQVIRALDDADLNPHPTSVQLILEYSQQLHQTA